MKDAQRLAPRDVVQTLFRHKKKIAATFCTIAGLVLLGILTWPRSYVSEAKLFVRVGRQMVTLDPTATTGETVEVRKSEQTDVITVMEILSGRRVAQRVVDELGADFILQGGTEEDSFEADDGGPVRYVRRGDSFLSTLKSSLGLQDHVSDRELAVERLLKSIQIASPRDSTVVSIICEAGSPKTAQTIVDTMVTQFLDEHLRVNRTEGSLEFFTRQKDHLEVALSDAAKELRNRKKEFRLLTVDRRHETLEKVLTDTRIQVLRTDGQLAAGQAKVRDLKRQLAKIPITVVTTELSGVESQRQGGMRQELFKLEAEKEGLLARYTKRHHRVDEVERKIASLEKILARESKELMQKTSGLNPHYQSVELLLATEVANVESLISQKKDLAISLARITEELNDVNDQSAEIEQLTRRVAQLARSHDSCAEKLEQARIDQAMKERRISNISIVQPATFVSRPVSPRKRASFLIGIAFAGFGSLAIALVAEVMDQTVKTTEQIEEALDLPVLISIPATRSHRIVYFRGRQQWIGSRKVKPEPIGIGKAALEGELIP